MGAALGPGEAEAVAAAAALLWGRSLRCITLRRVHNFDQPLVIRSRPRNRHNTVEYPPPSLKSQRLVEVDNRVVVAANTHIRWQSKEEKHP